MTKFKNIPKTLPENLSKIASGRDYLQTSEFANAVNRATQTIRKNVSLTGHCYGIKPLKIGGRLLWPVSEIATLFSEESK
ncbi:hypothetical protein [Duganella sp. Root1480D1]|uniref:hypothetical protein n=1 Tax=Duganella sp. Root1480D1 TaxID=1736471 RepID=UPI0009E72B33|nr:hypothetical protein [Duganella sp. Root1480D1]